MCMSLCVFSLCVFGRTRILNGSMRGGVAHARARSLSIIPCLCELNAHINTELTKYSRACNRRALSDCLIVVHNECVSVCVRVRHRHSSINYACTCVWETIWTDDRHQQLYSTDGSDLEYYYYYLCCSELACLFLRHSAMPLHALACTGWCR